MKKTFVIIIAALLCVLMLAPALSACNSSGARGGDTLVIYNWEDYIDETEDSKIVDDFAAYYKEITGRNLSITYTTFDTNETMMTKVLKGDANVDLIAPSEYAIEKLMLAETLVNMKDLQEELKPQLDEYGISFDNLDNIEKDVMDVIRSMFNGIESNGKIYNMTEYMVPYMWGTLGILYNTIYVTEEDLAKGWGILWNENQNPKLQNKILMKDSIRDSYAAAVLYMKEYDKLPEKYADYSVQQLINCTDREMLDAAERELTLQRDIISGYEVDFGKDDMLNEIVYVDLAWSGDALWAIEESYDEATDEYMLDYFVPEIGSNIWYDGWVIPKSVNNKLAAMMFIDYMCMPMSGARNSMYIGYTSAVDKDIMRADEDVCAFIEENEYDLEEYFGDIRRYPVINDKLGVMRDFGPSNADLVQMWGLAKAGKGVDEALIWAIVAVAAAGALIAGAFFLKEGLKLRARKSKGLSEVSE